MENIIIFGYLFFDLIIFVAAHIIIGRLIPKSSVFKILFRSYIIPLPLSAVLAIYLFFRLRIPIPSLIYQFLISVILYSISAMVYILDLLGIVESSIRIRLLTLIAAKSNKGMTRSELHEKYNAEIIIKKRIDRFISSGELIRLGNTLKKGSKFSPTLIPAKVIRLFWFLYSNRPW